MRVPRSLAASIVLATVLCPGLAAQSGERALDDAMKTMANLLSDDLARSGAKRAAVVEFGDAADRLGGAAGALGRYIAWAFPAELLKAGRGAFSLVDREATARILSEQELQLSGLVQEQGAVRAGRLLACDALVVGTIQQPERDAIAIGAKALSVETGAVLSTVVKRVSLTPEVEALIGREGLDSSAAGRLSAQGDRPYALRVRTAKGPKREYDAEGQRWILAERGVDYAIELENLTDRRVGVALLIDGVNTAFMRRESPARAVKWIIEPRSVAIVPGWQVDMGTARKFVFAGRAESVGASFGGEIGLITASFYPEELSPRKGASSEAGTKAGAAFGSSVSAVEVYLEALPAQVSAIRYDYREGLKARGISPSE